MKYIFTFVAVTMLHYLLSPLIWWNTARNKSRSMSCASSLPRSSRISFSRTKIVVLHIDKVNRRWLAEGAHKKKEGCACHFLKRVSAPTHLIQYMCKTIDHRSITTTSIHQSQPSYFLALDSHIAVFVLAISLRDWAFLPQLPRTRFDDESQRSRSIEIKYT
jgi:hypothetical protein